MKVTGTGAATVGLAGCTIGSDGDDGDDTGGGTTGDGPSDGTTGDDGDTGDDGSSGPPAPDENLVIGHLAPLSGSLGVIGRGSSRSAAMAVDELNQDGGVMDNDVEVIDADTESSQSVAQNEVDRLINQEDADVLIGTFTSEVTQAIINYVSAFNVPFIVTGSAAPTSVTDFIGQDYETYKNFFRTAPINSHFQAEATAQYADYLNERHGWTTFGFVAEDASWTRPFSDRLPDLLREKGYDVTYENRLALSLDNFSPVLDNLESNNVDAVFRFFANLVGRQFIGEWSLFEYPFSLEGIHVSAMHPDFYNLSDGIAAYMTTTQTGAGGAAAITDQTVPFVERYGERYAGQEPPVGHPMFMGFGTYDAINWWAQVAENAGTWDYENYLDLLVDTALDTEVTGVSGEGSLFGPDAEYPHDARPDRNADDVIVNFPVTQWRDGGGLECVYHGEYRSSDHLAPSWM